MSVDTFKVVLLKFYTDSNVSGMLGNIARNYLLTVHSKFSHCYEYLTSLSLCCTGRP
jgi:hypothetical protein